MSERAYIAIDLKSFYASVECVARGLNPLKTHLVVADPGRTEKTICLAVSPALKAYGVPGRARLFEVVEKVKEINAKRLMRAPNRAFSGKSSDAETLSASPELALDYIVAPPQMARYMEISAEVYQIYLRYIAPEDICVYSVDEVFIDATNYLATYRKTARQLAEQMIADVLREAEKLARAGVKELLVISQDTSAYGLDIKYQPSMWKNREIRTRFNGTPPTACRKAPPQFRCESARFLRSPLGIST